MGYRKLFIQDGAAAAGAAAVPPRVDCRLKLLAAPLPSRFTPFYSRESDLRPKPSTAPARPESSAGFCNHGDPPPPPRNSQSQRIQSTVLSAARTGRRRGGWELG